jgi:hypothetical protein
MHLATHSNNISVYKACIRDIKSLKNLSEPFLFSNANNIDLGTMPKYLPTLTEVKEMIIAYIYIHLQVVRVYKQQYQYTGHIVYFSQNTLKMWR